jgi:hypothetical protein
MSKQDKVFADGVWSEKKVFANGGELITLNINIKKFIDFIDQCNKAGHISEKGYLRLNVQSRRNPKYNSRGNEELNCSVDTWKPSPKPPIINKYDANDRPPQNDLSLNSDNIPF